MKPIYDSTGAPVRHYRRTTTTKAKRKRPEAVLQGQIKQFLEMTLPFDVEWTSSLSGAFLSPKVRAEMSAQGLRRGWADMQLCIRRRMYFMEVKAPFAPGFRPGPRYFTLDDPDLSGDQCRVLGALHPDCWVIVRSIEDVRDALVRWGVELRPHSLG